MLHSIYRASQCYHASLIGNHTVKCHDNEQNRMRITWQLIANMPSGTANREWRTAAQWRQHKTTEAADESMQQSGTRERERAFHVFSDVLSALTFASSAGSGGPGIIAQVIHTINNSTRTAFVILIACLTSQVPGGTRHSTTVQPFLTMGTHEDRVRHAPTGGLGVRAWMAVRGTHVRHAGRR